jgi:hypothetical protein
MIIMKWVQVWDIISITKKIWSKVAYVDDDCISLENNKVLKYWDIAYNWTLKNDIQKK